MPMQTSGPRDEGQAPGGGNAVGAPIIGTAGWSLPASLGGQFGAGASALERYASRFRGVEINSSFHRSHRPETWARWADSVPADFRFSVKLPKTISHQRKLVDCGDDLTRFLGEVGGLGAKLGALLLQLPPKLAFEARIAETFLSEARDRCAATLVCEPRHPSWFEPEADELLDRLGISRVAADPAPVPAGALPGGSRHTSYWRLHGSPQMYRSSYDERRLDQYAALLQADHLAGRIAWCIFDNTASSAAIHNALGIDAMVANAVTALGLAR